MRLNGEIFQGVDSFADARYTVVVAGGGYFQGVKAVGDFTPQTIVLYFSRGSVEVRGEALNIKKYVDGDLEISGRILSVTAELADKGKGK